MKLFFNMTCSTYCLLYYLIDYEIENYITSYYGYITMPKQHHGETSHTCIERYMMQSLNVTIGTE